MTSTTYADHALLLNDDDLGAVPINIPHHDLDRQPREVRSWVRYMRRVGKVPPDELLANWRELAARHRERGPIWDGLRGDPGEEARAAHLDATREVGRMVRAEIERRRTADAGDLALAAAVAADDLADMIEQQRPEREKIIRIETRLDRQQRALDAVLEPLQAAAKAALMAAGREAAAALDAQYKVRK